MKKYLYPFLFCCLFLLDGYMVSGQIRTGQRPAKKGDLLDSLRKIDEGKQDTVIYTARYIRYTTIDLLKDSTKLLPLDTTLRNFQNFNPASQPNNPTLNLGNVGLPYREMLFNPSKRIGFDVGFHSLDAYLLTEDSIHYYRARAPYTDLYYVSSGRKVQLFQATHSQNINPRWNFGANYFRNGSEGIYANQQADHLNAAIFTWYESKNKRYNILANGLFNTLKAAENGSVVRDSVFDSDESISRDAEVVRLNGTGGDQPRQTWKQRNFFLKQFYYIGRIDSLDGDTSRTTVLPTQRISHALHYSSNEYRFYRNEPDLYGAFPAVVPDTVVLTNDSTTVKNLSNELMYSFYLRGRSVKFIKNELKLDIGLQHDLYWYEQMGYKASFQNITLKAAPGYRFSNRVNIEGDLRQIVQGRNAGDFFYEAHLNFLLSRSAGRVILGAYSQNKSPEQIFERVNYQFHKWQNNFDRTKTNNLSFTYQNPRLKLETRADYFLISNYLYFKETPIRQIIAPEQLGTNINMLKVSLRKDFTFGKFNLENYLVYQKTDYQDILRTPELYTYHSFYFANTFFKVLFANIGVDVRYNSPFVAPSYAINIGQFYNGPSVKFSNYPVADVWLRATLKRASLLLKYSYANQGLFNKGYYTVNRYPMQDALLSFGLSWRFYD